MLIGGVHIKDKKTARLQKERDAGQGALKLPKVRNMIEAVHTADRAVDRAVELQPGGRLAKEEDVRTGPVGPLTGHGQHGGRRVGPDNLYPSGGEGQRKAAGAAGRVKQKGRTAVVFLEKGEQVVGSGGIVGVLHQPVIVIGEKVVTHSLFIRPKTN